MGVFSLWSRLRNEKAKLSEEVDLVQVAKDYPRGLKVLIDFYSWEQFVKGKFWKSLELIYGNSYLMFDGGEFELIDRLMKSLVEAFRSVNIELEFFLDGAKGSSHNATRQKLKTWENRHLDDQRSLAEIIRFLQGQSRLTLQDCLQEHIPRPCAQEIQNVLTLQEAGCIIHQRVSGEADCVIAQTLRDDERAFCVISNDTDFCIFPNGAFLSQDFFDLDNDLGLGGASITASKPKKLICRIFRSTPLIQRFGLRDKDDLIELATMGGNDFTTPILQKIPEFSSYKGKLEKIAQLIQKYGRAENCPFYGRLISQNPEMREAVEHSRKFYNLTLEDEELHQTGEVFNLLADGIRQCKYPSTVIAMHRGFYWHRLVLEEPLQGWPSAEAVWSDLRRFVYDIVAPFQGFRVTEYGRTTDALLGKMEISSTGSDRTIKLAQIKRNSFSRNMAIFEKIITHHEFKNFFGGKSLFKMFGIRMGFLVYLLRYFLIFNMGDNLYLSRQEVYALVAWTLSKHDHDKYRRLQILPSARCVTIENWFQALYRTAHAFLGNLLGLSHEFPAPKDVFGGATWVVLYTAAAIHDPKPAYPERCPMNVDPRDLSEANTRIREIVQEHRQIVKQLALGLFPFYT